MDEIWISPRSFETTSIEDAAALVYPFLEFLDGLGIVAKPRSDLEHGCLVLKQLAEHYRMLKKGRPLPPWRDFRDDLQSSLGMLNLVQLIMSLKDHLEFTAIVPHLRLLGEGSASQTTAAPAGDKIGDKIFELRLALSCMRSGSGLSLDDPIKSSGGKNPDIICNLRDGKKWGFACKVVHGDAPMSLFENFTSGVKQIELSEAEIGLVVVSLKNRIPHQNLFPKLNKNTADNPTTTDDPIFGVMRDPRIAMNWLSNLWQTRVYNMQSHVGADNVLEMLSGNKALPGIACPLETVVGIKTADGPVPSTISFLHTVRLERPGQTLFDEQVVNVLEDINSGLCYQRPISQALAD